MQHITVLLNEVIEGLELNEGDIFLDCTINGGGHSSKVAREFGSGIKIIGIDQDHNALLKAKELLESLDADFVLKEENFRNVDKVLDELKIDTVDKVVFDLGLSSNQLEESKRGFSFQKDEPLLMTFKTDPGESDITAREIVNEWEEQNIADIIYGYGDERFALRIARAIVEQRKIEPIETTFHLVRIIESAVPGFYRNGRINCATKTFQALRIAVNGETESLKEGLRKVFERLSKGGRIAVIAFHSLEDRIVKNYFRELKDNGEATIITKKPIVPSEEELRNNPRSRSAKLRIIQK
ncbi:MAG: 16S rRNA (cytosine(1402)-N(4))-methyltransferase RsmH [Candidatus Paceibacterota bacterium]